MNGTFGWVHWNSQTERVAPVDFWGNILDLCPEECNMCLCIYIYNYIQCMCVIVSFNEPSSSAKVTDATLVCSFLAHIVHLKEDFVSVQTPLLYHFLFL